MLRYVWTKHKPLTSWSCIREISKRTLFLHKVIKQIWTAFSCALVAPFAYSCCLFKWRFIGFCICLISRFTIIMLPWNLMFFYALDLHGRTACCQLITIVLQPQPVLSLCTVVTSLLDNKHRILLWWNAFSESQNSPETWLLLVYLVLHAIGRDYLHHQYLRIKCDVSKIMCVLPNCKVAKIGAWRVRPSCSELFYWCQCSPGDH